MEIFDIKLIKIGVEVSTKDLLLKMMSEELARENIVSDEKAYLDVVKAREADLSTGIGCGIGIPHGRHSGVAELKALVYILKQDLEYESLDGKPVRIVIMLAVPISCNSTYMKVLALISKALHSKENRELLLNSNSIEEIYNFLQRIQNEI